MKWHKPQHSRKEHTFTLQKNLDAEKLTSIGKKTEGSDVGTTNSMDPLHIQSMLLKNK